MSVNATNPLEVLLRSIDAASPNPVYPREFAQQFNLPPDQILYFLEHLWLDGLVERVGQHPEYGTGLTVSPLGKQVLQDPDKLQRLREGSAIVEGDRGGIVREMLRRERMPIVTYVLLFLNFAVFGYSVYLASGDAQLRSNFLAFFPAQGDAKLLALIHNSGAVHVTDLVRGEWWRLLSSCFVQIGLLHLGFNMWVLYSLGRQAETMWGPVRYLVLYILSGLGGSLLGATWHKAVMGGASGALCGIIASEGVWFLLNRHYLPHSVVRRFTSGFAMTAILLLVISMLPGISGYGHLGGAVVGAVVALLLNIERFGSPLVRIAAVIPILMAPLWGTLFLDYTKSKSKVWQAAETFVFETDLLKPIQETLQAARAYQKNNIAPLFEQHATRRDAEEVKKTRKGADKQLQELADMQAKLEGIGQYHQEIVETARKAALKAIQAQSLYMKESLRELELGEKWSRDDQAKLDELETEAQDAYREWRTLLE